MYWLGLTVLILSLGPVQPDSEPLAVLQSLLKAGPVVASMPVAKIAPDRGVALQPVLKPAPDPVVAPLPVLKPAPDPVVAPLPVLKPVPDPVVAPLPVLKPVPDPVVAPLPVLKPAPDPVVAPLPVLKPAPVPVVAPLPVVKPAPDPVVAPLPVLKPAPDPVVAPLPVLKPVPDPVVAPLPVLKPVPDPVVAPLPVLKPAPDPVVAPLPVLKPAPVPVVAPLPVVKPAPDPVVAPLPVLKPAPDPVVAPLPVLKPAPDPIVAPLPVVKPVPDPVVAPLPVQKPVPDPVVAPLPVPKPAPDPVVAPLPVLKPGDDKSPKAGSDSRDVKSPKAGSGSEDKKSPKPGSKSDSPDDKSPKAGSGSLDVKSPKPGSKSDAGDDKSPKAGSGSRDVKSPKAGSGSGDKKSPKPGSKSDSGDEKSPKAGSGSRDVKLPKPGSGSGDTKSPKPGSGSRDVKSPKAGSGSGDKKSPKPGSKPDTGDDKSPKPGSGSHSRDVKSPKTGSDSRDVKPPKAGSSSGDKKSPKPGSGSDARDVKSPKPGSSSHSRDVKLPKPGSSSHSKDVKSPRPGSGSGSSDVKSPRSDSVDSDNPRIRSKDRDNRPKWLPAQEIKDALKDVVGQDCKDKYSEKTCLYYKARGMCASKAISHVRVAWTKCRSTCQLCKEVVPDCLPGFRYNTALKTCVDIDECAEGTAACATNARCVNKEGSYGCQCIPGLVGNGKRLCQAQCTDASETCAKYAGDCTRSSRKIFMATACPVTCGLCKVTCAKGYRLGNDNKTCVNVNECAEKTGACPVHSTCTDTKGSYRCACNAGYIFNVVTQACVSYCSDLSTQCASLRSQCSVGSSLQQAWMATYCAATCQICDQPRCARGYKLSADGQCVDVDECSALGLNACAANATCINTEGSYKCQCNAGFRGNGFVECTTLQCYDLLSQAKCQAMKRTGGCQSSTDRAFRFCARTCKVCSNDDIKTCSKGYVASKDVCLDLNECKALTHKCPSNSACVNTFGGYRCTCNQGYSASKYTGQWQCVRENTCYVAGDPHFKTFDGAVIQFQGVCTYTLAKPDSRKLGILSDFNVEIKNEHRDGEMQLSWAKSVKISIQDIVILLDRNGVVYVNGERKAVPYSPNQGINITPSGRNIILSTMFGLIVSFDGYHYVKVSIPDGYKRKMTGICGNLDGISSNDYITKDGASTQSHAAIGNSWAIQDPTEVCQPATDEYLTDCSPQILSQLSGKGQCGILKSTDGPFAECIKKEDPSFAFESCMMDLCLSTLHPESLCRSLQAFADLCQTSGITVRWRSSTLCPMTCGDNSAYSPAMSACAATCFNPSSEGTCTSLPVEGCACSAGFVRDGFQKCVPVSQCGCQLNGVYHATGEIWYDSKCAFKYTCLKQSTILKVPITCQTSGACQAKDDKVACYCTNQRIGIFCDVESGVSVKVPCDSGYNPGAPYLPPKVVTPTTTTPVPITTPAGQIAPPHSDGEIADFTYFNEAPLPQPPPKGKPLGVESGVIPDGSLTASSYCLLNPTIKARPKSGGGWKPAPSDTKPYFTVDLGQPTDVHGIGTLGHFTDRCWVTNYIVLISLNGVTYTPLLDIRPEFNTEPRNFVGNSNQNSWKKHCLHQYYGKPVYTRYVRFQPVANNGCIGMRVEIYGFRDGNDPALIDVLAQDAWTRNTTGCTCYFDSGSTNCACCHAGGCQCPRSNLHQCVQCGYAEMCGIPEIKTRDEQLDPWTRSGSGCPCPFDRSRTDCACCQRLGCQCGMANRNQCVTCGHPEDCGRKEEVFGPNGYCTPKVCPRQ